MQLTIEDTQKLEALRHLLNCSIFERTKFPTILEELNLADRVTRGKFKFAYQYSVIEYQLIIAMEYAALSLMDGRQIKEVAESLSYSTSAHFCRAFRTVFGTTPGKYHRDKSAVSIAKFGTKKFLSM